MDKKIICKSNPLGTGSNFSIKLPETLNIPPGSELGVYGGQIGLNQVLNISSENNTFAVQFGSFDGTDVAVAGHKFNLFPPFLVEVDPGSYQTRGMINNNETVNGLILKAIVDAMNKANPYKCISFRGNYSNGGGDSELSIYGNVRSFDPQVEPVLLQYNNVNNITIAVDAIDGTSAAELTDVAGGYTVVSQADMVVPAPNQMKDFSIKFQLPQTATCDRLFFGYALEDQVNYRNNEEYNVKKDCIGLFNNTDGTLKQGPSATTASKYTNRLPLSIEVINNLVNIVTHELDEDGFIDESTRVNHVLLGSDVSAQDTEITCRFEFDNSGGGGAQQLVKFVCKTIVIGGADLDETTIDVPAYMFGNKFKFVGCIDTRQNVAVKLQILDENNLGNVQSEMNAGTDKILNRIFGASGAAGNLGFTMVFNKMSVGQRITDGVPAYNIGTSLQELSQKCNFDLLVANRNYVKVPGDAVDTDTGRFGFNSVSGADDNLCHFQILNLPIENYLCNPLKGDLKNIVYSTRYEGQTLCNNLQPFTIIYNKLTNKSDITINTLDIRIIDSDGRELTGIINSTEVWIHLRQGRGPTNLMMNKVTEKFQSLQNNFDLVLKKLS